jgi:phosphatidylglycerophosphate synthase
MNYTFTRPFRFLSPSQVTLIGLILALIGTYLITTAQSTFMLWIAIMILTISFLTDRLDGQLSRYFDMMRRSQDMSPLTDEEEDKMGWWERISWKGSSRTGRSFDPFTDKVRFVSLMWFIGHDDIWLTTRIVITIVAVLLTVIRHDNIKNGYDDGSSQGGGKTKVVIEVVAIAALVFTTEPITGTSNPLVEDWATEGLLNVLFIGAMIGGLTSLRGHWFKRIDGQERLRQETLKKRIQP